MKVRHEIKFQINQLEYQVLQKKLIAVLKPDSHAKSNNRYHVRNLYFDDMNNTALTEKQAGIFKRGKYRIRIYNHSDSTIKFERKSKFGPYILKESTLISRSEADRLIAGDFDFLAKTKDRLLRDFYLEVRCNLMRPVLILEYEREAYVQPIGNIRITFDTGMRTGLGSTSFFDDYICTMSALNQEGTILEVKYNEILPEYIRGLFPETIRPQLAIGKFVICRTQQINQTGSPLCGNPLKF